MTTSTGCWNCLITNSTSLASMTKALLMALATFCFQSLWAQEAALHDTSARSENVHSPSTATIMSALLPGLGQAYNKKYWKIPIIYGGFGGLALAINFNNVRYNRYRIALKDRIDGDPTTIDPYVAIYTDENLVTLKNFYRRNRDLTFIFTGALYALNILDAHIDAHLYYFDVSDDLSLRIGPALQDQFTPALALTLKFK